MSNWNPKPLRPADPNPLFQMGDETYVVKGQSAIQRQRAADGTPHTKCRPSALSAPDYALYLEDGKIQKSEPAPVAKALDPDLVVKSFLKGMVGTAKLAVGAGKLAVGGAKAAMGKGEGFKETAGKIAQGAATGALRGAAQGAGAAVAKSDEEEDAEKGVGSAVGKVAGAAGKTVVGAVSNLARQQ